MLWWSWSSVQHPHHSLLQFPFLFYSMIVGRCVPWRSCFLHPDINANRLTTTGFGPVLPYTSGCYLKLDAAGGILNDVVWYVKLGNAAFFQLLQYDCILPLTDCGSLSAIYSWEYTRHKGMDSVSWVEVLLQIIVVICSTAWQIEQYLCLYLSWYHACRTAVKDDPPPDNKLSLFHLLRNSAKTILLLTKIVQ